jgi:N utilization substance protein B
MLFQIDLTGSPADDVFRTFWTSQTDQTGAEDIRSFAERLVEGVVGARTRIDAVIAGSAENWRIERMPVVDRNVLRISIYEMLFEPDTPRLVSIDEAIEVAKRFGSGESGGFINGVLDDVRRRIERGELGASG